MKFTTALLIIGLIACFAVATMARGDREDGVKPRQAHTIVLVNRIFEIIFFIPLTILKIVRGIFGK